MTTRDAARAAQATQDPLVQLYQDAHLRIVQEQQKLLSASPLRTARLRRLLELQEAVQREMDRLDRRTNRWFERHGMEAYAAGFRHAAPDVSFTLIHDDAARRLADDLFQDLLQATRYVRHDTKRFIRDAAKIAAQSTVIDNTAVQAGRDMMKDLVQNHGIKAVTYRNGAKHPLGEYSQMTIRTKTAIAFSEGAFDSSPGVEWWECFDGPECGLSFHEDPTQANGLIRTRDESRGLLISHPNCRRSWGPRPDVTSKTGALKAQGTRAERLAAARHAVGR
jgi:hypothetical protein